VSLPGKMNTSIEFPLKCIAYDPESIVNLFIHFLW